MPLTHQTEVFNVDEAAIYKMLTDPSGGPATYGAKIPLPGIKSVSIDPDVLNKELYGDAKIIARGAKVRQLMLTANYAKLSLDALPVLAGGATVDAGTTPNQTAKYTFLGADTPNSFKLEFRVLQVGVGLGSLNVVLYKAKVTKFGLPATEEDFSLQALELAAIARIADDKVWDVTINETAATLSA